MKNVKENTIEEIKMDENNRIGSMSETEGSILYQEQQFREN